MRPVNLIPLEERRGEKTPLRTGVVPYVIVAVLALALVGVTLVVLASNQISDRKAEVASLQPQVDQAQAEAKKLESFTSFASLQQARQETVASLATSRFDWERVLRELAIVIPGDVWLLNVTASATPDVASGTSSSSSSSSSSSASAQGIEGPSLDIQGCAVGHDAVAGFLASLRDIDGVTRVSVLSSDRGDTSGSGASSPDSTSSSGAGAGCASRGSIVTFEVLVAFDSAQPAAATTGESAAAPAPATSDTSTAATTTTTSSDQSQVSDGEQQLQQQKDSAAQKTEQGRKAVGTFIPGTGSAP